VLNIYRNKPLLFVDGPPVFIKVAIIVEESTSVLILNNEEQSVLENDEQESVVEALPVNPGIQRKVIYLSNSFRRQAYQPLQFVLEEETLSGAIAKIDQGTVWIDLEGDTHDIIAVEMGKIEEVLWRGKPFEEIK